jgi:hypothetical protein
LFEYLDTLLLLAQNPKVLVRTARDRAPETAMNHHEQYPGKVAMPSINQHCQSLGADPSTRTHCIRSSFNNPPELAPSAALIGMTPMVHSLEYPEHIISIMYANVRSLYRLHILTAVVSVIDL